MANLSFIDQLDERQTEFANKIATKAKEMGIPPALAISIAYHESRLNPDVQRGSNGEFGIMQVMPNTGKSMGYTNKDLGDPDKNIEAGLKYLKQNLDAFGGDPQMATVGYNAGTNSPFFSGGELPKTTEDYVKAMKGYGAFNEAQTENNKDLILGDATPLTPSPPNAEPSGATPGERFLGGLLGSAVGAGATGIKGLAETRTNMAAQRAGAEETARIAAQRAAGVSPPALGASPAGAKPPPGSTIMRQPIPTGGPDGGRLPAGQRGTMPYNYAIAAGLTDIEAGRALDMTKQAGGVHDLATQRREGLNKIQQLGGGFTENPRYGGIMTPDQSVGGGPRQSFSMKAPVPPSPEMPKGQPGGLSQLPPRQPISMAPVAPKAPSGLESVTSMFKGMMRPIVQAAATVGRYVAPPLAGLSAGLDLAEMGNEYNKPSDQRDNTKMGLKAASAIGGGLSMIPATAPVGIPLAVGASAYDYYRSNPDLLKKKMQGMADVPMIDEMTAPRF